MAMAEGEALSSTVIQHALDGIDMFVIVFMPGGIAVYIFARTT